MEKRILVPSKHEDEAPVDGDLVCIHYEMRLEDGTLIDSSRARGKRFEFHLGEGAVIDGWEMLISTMALGERAELVVPPQYAYGEDGSPPYVPPNETLTFDVTLLDIGRPVDDPPEEDADASGVADAVLVEEEEAEDEEALYWEKDPEREGGMATGFSWQATGSGREICVTIPLSEDVKVKDLKVDVRTFSMVCKVGPTTIVDGELFADVDMDDSYWDLDRKGKGLNLLIYLPKLKKDLKWESLLKGGDPKPVAKGKTSKPVSGEAEPVDVEVVDVDKALNLANEQRRMSDLS